MSNINNTKEQYELNRELAQMLKGGVIMDVTNAGQAKIAEAAGACAVMALERIPADIRAAGGGCDRKICGQLGIYLRVHRRADPVDGGQHDFSFERL